MGSLECRNLEKTLKVLLDNYGCVYTLDISDDIDLFIKYKINKTPALLINDTLIHHEELSNTNYLKSIIENFIKEEGLYNNAS